MLTLHPYFIKDDKENNSMVILPAKKFNTIIEELQDFVAIELYDEAKKEEKGIRILFSDYLKNRKNND